MAWVPAAHVSPNELLQLGDGVIAYLRHVSAEQAKKSLPNFTDIPDRGKVVMISSATGEPIGWFPSYEALLGYCRIHEKTPVVQWLH